MTFKCLGYTGKISIIYRPKRNNLCPKPVQPGETHQVQASLDVLVTVSSERKLCATSKYNVETKQRLAHVLDVSITNRLHLTISCAHACSSGMCWPARTLFMTGCFRDVVLDNLWSVCQVTEAFQLKHPNPGNHTLQNAQIFLSRSRLKSILLAVPLTKHRGIAFLCECLNG